MLLNAAVPSKLLIPLMFEGTLNGMPDILHQVLESHSGMHTDNELTEHPQ